MKREQNQREKLWEEATGHCIYCGRPVKMEEMEIDHIVPLCQGGDNSFENKVCSCPRCNAAKAGMLLEDYVEKHMTASQRKRFSNRITHLLLHGKMDWDKADKLDPYSTELFDDDWDDELDDEPVPEEMIGTGLHITGNISFEIF